LYHEVPDSDLDVVKIFYKTLDMKSQELISMSKKPSKVAVNNMEITGIMTRIRKAGPEKH